MTSKKVCDYCKGTAFPGIHIPADFDDREPSRDGKVFVAKCDECGRYDSDLEAAEVFSKALGLPVARSLDCEDDVDPTSRAQKEGTSFFRPYFNIPLAQALKLGAN